MAAQRRVPWLTIILGVGCVSALCIGVLVVGGGAYYILSQRSAIPSVPEPQLTFPAESLLPSATPVPLLEPTAIEPTASPAPLIEPTLSEPTATSAPVSEPTLAEPTQPEPTEASTALTGQQSLTDYSLFDDFSSEALGWPVYDDGSTILKVENEAYSFQIAEPDYYDWAYLPVDFIPYEIWFDVQAPEGSQDGTFGVFCQYQDADNYYYVEFDLADNTYLIGQILDGESVALEGQNVSGDEWQSTEALNSPPSVVNRIGVTCYLDFITLFINDQWVAEASVSQPFEQPGEAAFFVYAFDIAGEQGYKVIFDNVETYQPVQ